MVILQGVEEEGSCVEEEAFCEEEEAFCGEVEACAFWEVGAFSWPGWCGLVHEVLHLVLHRQEHQIH